MPSLETLRRMILLNLKHNRNSSLRDLADAVTDDVARFIATEATLEAFDDGPAPTEDEFFHWPPPPGLLHCEVLRLDGAWVRVDRDRPGVPLVDIEWVPVDRWQVPPAIWRYPEDMKPAGGGFGARHVGRPRQTVTDSDGRCPDCSGGGWLPSTPCPRCEGTGQVTKSPRERMFFPRAFSTPGGDRWLAENGVRLWP